MFSLLRCVVLCCVELCRDGEIRESVFQARRFFWVLV